MAAAFCCQTLFRPLAPKPIERTGRIHDLQGKGLTSKGEGEERDSELLPLLEEISKL